MCMDARFLYVEEMFNCHPIAKINPANEKSIFTDGHRSRKNAIMSEKIDNGC